MDEFDETDLNISKRRSLSLVTLSQIKDIEIKNNGFGMHGYEKIEKLFTYLYPQNFQKFEKKKENEEKSEKKEKGEKKGVNMINRFLSKNPHGRRRYSVVPNTIFQRTNSLGDFSFLDKQIKKWFTKEERNFTLDELKNDFKKTLIDAKGIQSHLVRINSENLNLQQKICKYNREWKCHKSKLVNSCSTGLIRNHKLLRNYCKMNNDFELKRNEDISLQINHFEEVIVEMENKIKEIYIRNQKLNREKFNNIKNKEISQNEIRKLKGQISILEKKNLSLEKKVQFERIEKNKIVDTYNLNLVDLDNKEKRIITLMYDNNRKQKEGFAIREELEKVKKEKIGLKYKFKSHFSKINKIKEIGKKNFIKNLIIENEQVKKVKISLIDSHDKMKNIIAKQQKIIRLLRNDEILMKDKKFCSH